MLKALLHMVDDVVRCGWMLKTLLHTVDDVVRCGWMLSVLEGCQVVGCKAVTSCWNFHFKFTLAAE